MLLKCCTKYTSQFGKLSSAHRTGIVVFLAIPKKVISKNVQLLHSSTHLTCYQSNFSKQVFNSTWTVKYHMFKLELEKAEEPEIKWPTFVGSWKEQESSRKISTSALLTLPKPFTMWITTNCRRFLKRWEYQTSLPASWEMYAEQEATVRTDHGKMDWFQIEKGGMSKLYIVTVII